MRPQLVEELEEFIRAGQIWDQDDLGGLISRLEAESDDTGDPSTRDALPAPQLAAVAAAAG